MRNKLNAYSASIEAVSQNELNHSSHSAGEDEGYARSIEGDDDEDFDHFKDEDFEENKSEPEMQHPAPESEHEDSDAHNEANWSFNEN